jgi:FG-GAP-like repeat
MEKRFRTVALGAACALAVVFAGTGAAADATFVAAPGSPFTVGDGPHSIVDADFNRDGRADLATANVGSDNVSILRGDGTGRYTAAATLQVGDEPHGIAAGDFNRDGRVDLAVTNARSNNVSILLGNGSGGFSPAPGSPVGVAPNPWFVAVEDLNRDGRQDLAVAHAGCTSSTVCGRELTILLGSGSGRFSQAPSSPLQVDLVPYGIAIADLNRDGKLDIAVPNQFSSTITILLGNGDGTFILTAGPLIPPGSAPSWIATEDYDADGDIDLAVTLKGIRTVAIFLGNGAGGFTPGSLIPVGRGPTPVAAADLNGDGRYDLAVANQFDGTASIYFGNGDGTFLEAAGSPIAVGDNPFALSITPANRDGRLDIAVAVFGAFDAPAPDGVTLLLNKTPSDRRPICRGLDIAIERLDLFVPYSPWAVQLSVQQLNRAKRAAACGS